MDPGLRRDDMVGGVKSAAWPSKLTAGRDQSASDIIVFVVVGDGIVVFAGLFVVAGGDDIGAGQPAVEVDVGAALRAEGLELDHCGLAADRAFAIERHQTPVSVDWLSQLKCTG